jgi:hypothetical protein
MQVDSYIRLYPKQETADSTPRDTLLVVQRKGDLSMKSAPGFFFILAVISSFSLSCASTKTTLTWVWEDETYQGGLLDGIMVVGVSDNFERRRIFEDIMVEEFEDRDVKAVSSAAVISAEEELTRERVLAEVEKLGLDAILITYLLWVKEEDKFVPPATSEYPDARYARFNIYSYATGIYSSYGGSYSEEAEIKLDTHIYEAESQMMIWSAKSKTTKAKYVSKVTDTLATAVIRDLREKKLIK